MNVFVFDIETVIDIESSGSFLGLNSEACKSEIAEKMCAGHDVRAKGLSPSWADIERSIS